MKQLVILSGKGGTGKTTLASAFIKLNNTKLFADCDVDAPNLHLIYNFKNKKEKKDFYGSLKANINDELCIGCNTCKTHCKFNAILIVDNKANINKISCEGCGVCEFVCPMNAISLIENKAGETYVYSNDNQIFSTARLDIGNGASGKLVSEVKKNLLPYKDQCELAVIDGSPGIGCPVIASLNGANYVIIVTEPSLSGISDLKRIMITAKHFGVKIFVCINKYDVNIEKCEEIEKYCELENVTLLGKIPYDKDIINATNKGCSIIEYDTISSKAIIKIYENFVKSVR